MVLRGKSVVFANKVPFPRCMMRERRSLAWGQANTAVNSVVPNSTACLSDLREIGTESTVQTANIEAGWLVGVHAGGSPASIIVVHVPRHQTWEWLQDLSAQAPTARNLLPVSSLV